MNNLEKYQLLMLVKLWNHCPAFYTFSLVNNVILVLKENPLDKLWG